MKRDPNKVDMSDDSVVINYYEEQTKFGFFDISSMIKDRLSYFTVYQFDSNQNNFNKFIKHTQKQVHFLVDILEKPMLRLGKVEKQDSLKRRKILKDLLTNNKELGTLVNHVNKDQYNSIRREIKRLERDMVAANTQDFEKFVKKLDVQVMHKAKK